MKFIHCLVLTVVFQSALLSQVSPPKSLIHEQIEKQIDAMLVGQKFDERNEVTHTQLRSGGEFILDSIVGTDDRSERQTQHFLYDSSGRLTAIENLIDNINWGSVVVNYDDQDNLSHYSISDQEEVFLFYLPDGRIDSTSNRTYFPGEWLWERQFVYDSTERLYQTFDYYTDVDNLFEFDGAVSTYHYDQEDRIIRVDQLVYNPNIGAFEPLVKIEYDFLDELSYESRIWRYNINTQEFDLIYFIWLDYDDAKLVYSLVNSYGNIPGEPHEVEKEWWMYDGNGHISEVRGELEEYGAITLNVLQTLDFDIQADKRSLSFPGSAISSSLTEQLNVIQFRFLNQLQELKRIMSARLLSMDEAYTTPNTFSEVKQTFHWRMLTDVSNVISTIDFEIWPNPTFDLLNVDRGDLSNLSYEIHTIDGTLVMQGNTPNSIDVSQLRSGFYLIKVYGANGHSISRGFTKM